MMQASFEAHYHVNRYLHLLRLLFLQNLLPYLFNFIL